MNTKKVIALSLAGLLVLFLAGTSVWAAMAYRAPLGPALELPGPSPAPAAAGFQAAAAEVAQAIPVVAQGEVCGESGVWNLLVLGSDAADLRDPKGSDLTRLLRVDFPNQHVVMFNFPRGLWVETAGLGLTNPTIEATQLGEVFYEARARSQSTNVQTAMVDATEVTARTLANNFLVSTDHYLSVDLARIPAMVDTIGGVPVNIPATITDPVTGMTIHAGQQTLKGAQFAVYARAIPDSDFARMQRDTLLLDALRAKLVDPAYWSKIPELYAQFKDVIATDLSPEQIEHLSCLMKEVPQSSIVQDSVRQEWTSPGPQPGSLSWDTTAVLNRLKELGLTP